MDKTDKDDIHYHIYPTIEGKMKNNFGFQPNLINKIKYKMYELYSKSNIRNPVLSSQIHGIILNLFIEEYYPLQSRNIKSDSKTMPVVMGGYAFNLNIPKKMQKMLYTETDDIDIKIYTTEINSIVKQTGKLEKVLFIFKYINILICFYIKQIIKEMIEYSRIIFEPNEPYKKNTIKNIINYSLKNNLSKTKTKSKSNSKSKTKTKTKTKSKTKTNTKTKSNQIGGEYIANAPRLIKVKQRRFGVFKSCKIKIIITKKGQEKEIIDITDLSYIDTYKLIMKKIVDPDVLIKTKISYSIKYINLIIPYSYKSIPSISFSDTKIIYPTIHNPSFYSYYFMNNRKQLDESIKLENLLNKNINITDIINTKFCKNNWHYISVKCLQIDIIYMLKFAELIEIEDLPNGIVLVPVESLFKYYKYIIKFIRLHIIKRFFNGTLTNNKIFIDTSRKLIRYAENNLHKSTSQLGETLPLNILYKKIISDFHQAFFIKKTMFPEYDALIDLVNDYNTSVHYINRSCALFKKLDDEDKHSGESIESISIQNADKQVKDDIKDKIIMNGGKIEKVSKKSKIILHNDYSFEDIELDNKDINLKIDKTKTTSLKNNFIIEKIQKMLKNEIQFLGKLSNSIKK